MGNEEISKCRDQTPREIHKFSVWSISAPVVTAKIIIGVVQKIMVAVTLPDEK
ncbi:MAG TPA: hypothetical protein VK203_02845 [Nostocaceae cyanobacterium]|nr:hypothetical protein [Nostocaceae cyanobacterium]